MTMVHKTTRVRIARLSPPFYVTQTNTKGRNNVTNINFSYDPIAFIDACANPHVALMKEPLNEEQAVALERVLHSCARNGTVQMLDVSQFVNYADRVKAHQAGIRAWKENPEPPVLSAILYIGASGDETPSGGFYFGYQPKDKSTAFALFFLRDDGALQLEHCGSIRGRNLHFARDSVSQVQGNFVSGAYAMFRASLIEDSTVTTTTLYAL
jgi:hypothetical protein